jgi:hypothetical protein
MHNATATACSWVTVKIVRETKDERIATRVKNV